MLCSALAGHSMRRRGRRPRNRTHYGYHSSSRCAQLCAGLINLRGTLVTVMDASMCLYRCRPKAQASILLVERRGRLAGVIVDGVFDIQSLPVVEVEGGARLDLRAMVDTALA